MTAQNIIQNLGNDPDIGSEVRVFMEDQRMIALAVFFMQMGRLLERENIPLGYGITVDPILQIKKTWPK